MTMPTLFRSDQEAKRLGHPAQKLNSTESGGKVTRALFSKTVPDVGLALGDAIQLRELPPDVALVGGRYSWDRAQGAATTAIGPASDPTRYGAPTVTPGPGVVRIAEQQDQHFAEVLTAPTTLYATNGRAPWVPGSTLKGFIEYIAA
jgi:hypothetical protein